MGYRSARTPPVLIFAARVSAHETSDVAADVPGHGKLEERVQLIGKSIERVVDLLRLIALELDDVDDGKSVFLLGVPGVERGNSLELFVQLGAARRCGQRRDPPRFILFAPREERRSRRFELIETPGGDDQPLHHPRVFALQRRGVVRHGVWHVQQGGRKETRVIDEVRQQCRQRTWHRDPGIAGRRRGAHDAPFPAAAPVAACLLLLNLRPAVTERDSAIEYETTGLIAVATKIPGALELVGRAGLRLTETGLELCAAHDLQRLGIEVVRPVLPLLDVAGILLDEEVLEETNLRLDGMPR